MPVNTYRYTECAALPGLCIGVTRHLPRGVRRDDYRTRGYFDVWLPNLAPSPALLSDLRRDRIDFRTFSARYRREMRRPEARHVIALIAAMSEQHPINLGCYCIDAKRCHRTLLAELIMEKTKHTRTRRAPRFLDNPRG